MRSVVLVQEILIIHIVQRIELMQAHHLRFFFLALLSVAAVDLTCFFGYNKGVNGICLYRADERRGHYGAALYT